MHDALASFLRLKGNEIEPWEADALAQLTRRREVPFEHDDLERMLSVLREHCRPPNPISRQ